MIDHVRQGVDESPVDHWFRAPMRPGEWRQLYRDGPHEQVDHFYVDDLPLASPDELYFYRYVSLTCSPGKIIGEEIKKGRSLLSAPFYKRSPATFYSPTRSPVQYHRR